MADLNRVILCGRMGSDPEISTTQRGTSVAKVSIATNDYLGPTQGEKASWHRLVFWGKAAENVAKWFFKGSRILIEGRISYSVWEKDGIKRESTEIICDKFYFVESRNQGGNGGGPRQQKSEFDPPDDDIPF